MPDDKVNKLFEGDPRCEQLLNALEELIYERGGGVPIPLIIGVLELLKLKILEDQK